jgi:uncharacterized RDD family membrane protein YckC
MNMIFKRILADFIDLVVIASILALTPGHKQSLWLSAATDSGVAIAYFLITGAFNISVGRRIFGLMIQEKDGRKLRFQSIIKRYSLYLFLCVAWIAASMISKNASRWVSSLFIALYLFEIVRGTMNLDGSLLRDQISGTKLVKR